MLTHILITLEKNHSNDYIILPSQPVEEDHHSLLIAIDPTVAPLTYNLDLSHAVIVGAHKTTRQLIGMLESKNLQIGYILPRDEQKSVSHIKLLRIIKEIVLDFYSSQPNL